MIIFLVCSVSSLSIIIAILAPISCACNALVTKGQSPLGINKNEFSKYHKNIHIYLEYFSVELNPHYLSSPGVDTKFATIALPNLENNNKNHTVQIQN